MPDALRSDVAQMASLFAQAIVYGAYLVTFLQTLVCIFMSEGRLKPAAKIQWATLAVVLFLWVNSTLNLSLGLVRQMQGYIFNDHGSQLLDQVGENWVTLAKIFGVGLQIFVADWMLIYRCWRVYNKSVKIILFPLVLWMVGVAIWIWAFYCDTQIKEGSRVNNAYFLRLSATFFALTVTLNIYATSSIVYKIWRAERDMQRMEDTINRAVIASVAYKSRSRLHAAIKIIVESALLYTMTSIVVFACQISRSNSVFISASAEIIVVGISFNLIVIRVDRERTREKYAMAQRLPESALKFQEPTSQDSTRDDMRELEGRSTLGTLTYVKPQEDGVFQSSGREEV